LSNTKCHIDTGISTDDGHIEKNKHTKKNRAPSWLYLQGFTGMHGQQNI